MTVSGRIVSLLVVIVCLSFAFGYVSGKRRPAAGSAPQEPQKVFIHQDVYRYKKEPAREAPQPAAFTPSFEKPAPGRSVNLDASHQRFQELRTGFSIRIRELQAKMATTEKLRRYLREKASQSNPDDSLEASMVREAQYTNSVEEALNMQRDMTDVYAEMVQGYEGYIDFLESTLKDKNTISN